MFSKNFQEIHLLSKMFLKVYFLHCSVIKVPVVTDLHQQLIQFITLFSACQLFFCFSFQLFVFYNRSLTAFKEYHLKNDLSTTFFFFLFYLSFSVIIFHRVFQIFYCFPNIGNFWFYTLTNFYQVHLLKTQFIFPIIIEYFFIIKGLKGLNSSHICSKNSHQNVPGSSSLFFLLTPHTTAKICSCSRGPSTIIWASPTK